MEKKDCQVKVAYRYAVTISEAAHVGPNRYQYQQSPPSSAIEPALRNAKALLRLFQVVLFLSQTRATLHLLD